MNRRNVVVLAAGLFGAGMGILLRMQEERAALAEIERRAPATRIHSQPLSEANGPAATSMNLIPAVCFTPGTRVREIEKFHNWQHLIHGGAASRAQLSSRWSSTATNGGGLVQGTPITLTWGFVPDGLNIPGSAGEPAAPSNLVAWLNALYGNQTVWQPLFQQVFDRWSALTGVRYVYEPRDDGAVFPNSAGALGVRPDIRISAHRIDGNSGILAYNFYPNSGDMVLDAQDSFFSTTSANSLRLRNVLAHEHGHGLGLAHCCPVNQTKLMEPFVTTIFDGPQHDDIYGGNRHYGDPLENNDTSTTASPLGSLAAGSSTTVNNLSVDDNADVDFFKFTVGTGSTATVRVDPVGFTYLQGIQNGDGSCSGGSSFTSLSQNDLTLQVLNTNGTSILASANANPAGVAETISSLPLPGAGTFFVRVSGGTADAAQLYMLKVDIAAGGPVDSVPSAAHDNLVTNEDQSATVNVLANDSGLADVPLALTLSTLPANGSATVNAGNTITYTPAPNFKGTDSFVYRIADKDGQSSTATVSVTVNPVNDPPVFGSLPTAAPNPAQVGQTVLFHASATDADGDPLTFAWNFGDGTTGAGSDPSHAYAAQGNFSVTVTVTDGQGGSLASSLGVTVQAAAAVAQMPFSETFEGGALAGYWKSTGSGPFRTLIATANGPHGGTRHLTMDGSASATYARNELTLTLNLAGWKNVTLAFWAKEFGDEAHTTASPFTQGANFDGVAISADGNLWHVVRALTTLTSTYAKISVDLDAAAAAAGISYNSAFKIRLNQYDNYPIASDGLAFDDLDITGVFPQPGPPQAGDDSATTSLGAAVAISVLANDSDPDSDPLSLVSVSQPAHGTAVNNGNGTVTYTPAAGFTGTDSFTYTVTDHDEGSDTATVTVQVLGNVATLPFVEGFEGTALSAWWKVTGTNQFRTRISTANGPHGGTRHLVMDDTTADTLYSRNELTLTVNLAGKSNVVLSFWAREYGDEAHSGAASFTGGADFDGVAISADGNTWYRIQSLTTLTSAYSKFTINLDSAAANAGISFNSAFKIRFNQYDNYPVATDGIAFDDISVTGN